MADEQSNIDRLEAANALDASNMSDEHKRIINEEMTEDEINALISAKLKIAPEDPWKPDRLGFSF